MQHKLILDMVHYVMIVQNIIDICFILICNMYLHGHAWHGYSNKMVCKKCCLLEMCVNMHEMKNCFIQIQYFDLKWHLLHCTGERFSEYDLYFTYENC